MFEKVYDIKGEKCIFLYEKNFISKEMLRKYREILDKDDRWKGGETSYGKEIKRKQIWCHMNGKYFNDTWRKRYDRWESYEYNEEFLKLQRFLNEKCSKILEKHDIDMPEINSMLLNKYRDGNDTIKPHKDNDISFGKTPVVFVISIGDTRNLNFQPIIFDENNKKSCKHDKTRKDEKISIPLEEGSLFIMAGYTQKHFVHSIDKEENKTIRYSLTFREHIC